MIKPRARFFSSRTMAVWTHRRACVPFPEANCLSEGVATRHPKYNQLGRHIDERVRALIHSINGSFWVLFQISKQAGPRARGGAPHRRWKALQTGGPN